MEAGVLVVVTGAEPVAVADGLVALPAGKGGMIVAEVDTGIGATTVGVVVGADVVDSVELDDVDDVEADEVNDADWALWVPLGLSQAWVSMKISSHCPP